MSPRGPRVDTQVTLCAVLQQTVGRVSPSERCLRNKLNTLIFFFFLIARSFQTGGRPSLTRYQNQDRSAGENICALTLEQKTFYLFLNFISFICIIFGIVVVFRFWTDKARGQTQKTALSDPPEFRLVERSRRVCRMSRFAPCQCLWNRPPKSSSTGRTDPSYPLCPVEKVPMGHFQPPCCWS